MVIPQSLKFKQPRALTDFGISPLVMDALSQNSSPMKRKADVTSSLSPSRPVKTAKVQETPTETDKFNPVLLLPVM